MVNSNSYICIDIPNDIKEILHQYALRVKDINPNFKPMGKENIHMTFVFLGERKYKEVLNIKQYLDQIKNIELILKFDKVSLFPPSKENLLIFQFKINELSLRNKILNFLQIEDEFLPHITLGKYVGKKDNIIMLNDIESVDFKSNRLILNNPYFI